MAAEKTISKSYKLPESLFKKIQAAAKKEDRSPHSVVIRALKKAFSK